MNGVFWKTIIVATAVFAVALLWGNSSGAVALPNWAQGASGYRKAHSEAKDSGRPFILYFSTEWCKWCKKMDNKYLASSEIERFLSDIPKVIINPDSGSAEYALYRQYRVKSFPAFLITIPAFGNQAVKVHPFLKSGNLSVDEFLAKIKDRIARQYTKEALSSYKRKAYQAALSHIKMAITYNPDHVYAYYLRGRIHHSRGYMENNLELLKTAEENYQKVLALKPDHKKARKELNKLTKLMERGE